LLVPRNPESRPGWVERAIRHALRHDRRVTTSDGESAAVPTELRESILAWYDRTGRDLPFRATSDPYAILVSEAMAQQTQAARAGEAWVRFMDTYPTVAALASATPADVLRSWRGLGYNRRALNLLRAARRIMEVHGGGVPADLAELEALPGGGPYTARAVASLAFGMPVGAVDTNVRRVLGRIVAGATDAMGTAELQRIADAAVPVDRPAAWTHALMDLGASLCASRSPVCEPCPARRWCRFAAGTKHPGEPAATMAAAPDRSRPTVRKAPTPFVATTRWLRGRIVDRLRATDGDAWTIIAGPIGGHDREAVEAALEGLERDGMVELQGTRPDRDDPAAGRRARLTVS
jgi:A/G-specific adenine glycosylase